MSRAKGRQAAKRKRNAEIVFAAIDANTSKGKIDEHTALGLLEVANLHAVPASTIRRFFVEVMKHARDVDLARMCEIAEKELTTAREIAAARHVCAALEQLGIEPERAEKIVDDLTTELWTRPAATAHEAVH